MEENSSSNLITKQIPNNSKTNSTNNNQNDESITSPIQINRTKLSQDSNSDMEIIINEIFKRTEKNENNNDINDNKIEHLKNEKMNGLTLEKISENSENNSNSSEKHEPIKHVKSQIFSSYIEKYKEKQIKNENITKEISRKSMAVKLKNNLLQLKKMYDENGLKSKTLVRYSISSSCYRKSINLDSPVNTYFSPRKKSPRKLLSRNNKNNTSEHSLNLQSVSKITSSEESSFKLDLINFRKVDVYRQKFNNQLRINRQNVLKISILNYMKPKFLYKDTKKLIFNLKILYIFMIIFSLISIISSFIEGKLYYKNSINYILGQNITYLNCEMEINSYLILKKRKIISKENIYRLLNGIFSILICILFIIINYQTIKFVNTKKKTKKNK